MNAPLPRENELKLALATRADYETLIERLGTALAVKEQVNYYFDTPGHELLNRRMSLRVRDEDGRLLVSLKRGRGWNEGYLEGEELESPAPAGARGATQADLTTWDVPPVRVLKEEFGSLQLVCLGFARNTRMVYEIEGGIRMELDRTEFPGGVVEYEVEAEWEDEEEVRRVVTRLLDGWQVSYSPQTRTKHQRFLSSAGLPDEPPDAPGRS